MASGVLTLYNDGPQVIYQRNYYTTVGRLVDRYSAMVEIFDRLLMFFRSLGTIIAYSLALLGQSFLETGQKIINGLDKARGVISATRFIISIESIISRKILFEQDPVTGDFLRFKVNEHNDFETDDQGNFIPDVNGKKMFRHWGSIACDIILTIGRFISPILWLDRMKVIVLGEHAKWLGGMTLAAFTAVTAICTIRAIEDFIKDRCIPNFIEILSNVFDAAVMLWENGVVVDPSNLILNLVGGVILTIAAFLAIFKETYKSAHKYQFDISIPVN